MAWQRPRQPGPRGSPCRHRSCVRESPPVAKIYTKTGDDGTTGLLSGGRLAKDALRIEAYGTIDELNSVLGVARALGLAPADDALVEQVQDDLFAVGSALADPNPAGPFHSAIGAEQIGRLEHAIDA